jgi:DNA-binding MarR family transcriptional regulator
MNTLAPPFTALIGQTENALVAILNRELAGTGVTDHQWTALVLAAAGEPASRGQLTARVARALATDQATAAGHIDALVAAGLAQARPDPGSGVALTEAGQQLLGRVRKQTGEITQQLWGDLPAAELQTAHRVLSTMLERAQAELAASS